MGNFVRNYSGFLGATSVAFFCALIFTLNKKKCTLLCKIMMTDITFWILVILLVWFIDMTNMK